MLFRYIYVINHRDAMSFVIFFLISYPLSNPLISVSLRYNVDYYLSRKIFSFNGYRLYPFVTLCPLTNSNKWSSGNCTLGSKGLSPLTKHNSTLHKKKTNSSVIDRAPIAIRSARYRNNRGTTGRLPEAVIGSSQGYASRPGISLVS